jgi:hypothetical protein
MVRAYSVESVRLNFDDIELSRKSKYSLGGQVLPQFIQFSDWETFEIPWIMGGLTYKNSNPAECRNVPMGNPVENSSTV